MKRGMETVERNPDSSGSVKAEERGDDDRRYVRVTEKRCALAAPALEHRTWARRFHADALKLKFLTLRTAAGTWRHTARTNVLDRRSGHTEWRQRRTEP
jgi:hypothetical protein